MYSAGANIRQAQSMVASGDIIRVKRGYYQLANMDEPTCKTRRSYQLCLQLFCQEEFLRRVSLSRYADSLALHAIQEGSRYGFRCTSD